MSFLLRTRAGGFDLSGARTWEEIERDASQGALTLIPKENALPHLPVYKLRPEGERRMLHGQPVGMDLVMAVTSAGERGDQGTPPPAVMPPGPVRLHGEDGRLVAVADPDSTARGLVLRPRIVFA